MKSRDTIESSHVLKTVDCACFDFTEFAYNEDNLKRVFFLIAAFGIIKFVAYQYLIYYSMTFQSLY